MASTSPVPPLRILCLEDNPLIVFHLEHMIEDLGHVFCGALESFEQLRDSSLQLEIDVALVDIDLADGSTGPAAARWLLDQGVPAIFITGQKDVAERNADAVVATLIKPISTEHLRHSLELIQAGR